MHLFVLVVIALLQSSSLLSTPLPCFGYLQQNYFSYNLVAQALSLNNIDQPYWVPIYNSLQAHSRELPARYEQKTAGIPSASLTIDIARQKIIDSLYEIFVISCLENQIKIPTLLERMFKYIMIQNTYMVESCFAR